MYEVTIKNKETGEIENTFETYLATLFCTINTSDERTGVACVHIGRVYLEELTKHFLGVFQGLKTLKEEDPLIDLAMSFVEDCADKFDMKTENMK